MRITNKRKGLHTMEALFLLLNGFVLEGVA